MIRKNAPSNGTIEENIDQEFHIMIVDDEESILRSLKRELRGQPYQITAFNDPHAALEALQNKQYSLIISDNRMPGMTGVELLEQVGKISPDTVRIILTGYTDLESAVRAINKGGITYFVTKPWERDQLLGHIQEGLEKFKIKKINQILSQELREKNEILSGRNKELKNMAIRDLMTNLFNHAEFQDNLDRQIKLFRRDSRSFCFALGDIDNFKQVNDTHGHPAGDEVIKAIAYILSNSLREEVDTTYRYGGEEFAIILRDTTEEQACLVIVRLIEKIASFAVPIPEGKLVVTMSFGIGQYQPDKSKEEFVGIVDQALYNAKRTGKNRVSSVSAIPQ